MQGLIGLLVAFDKDVSVDETLRREPAVKSEGIVVRSPGQIGGRRSLEERSASSRQKALDVDVNIRSGLQQA